MNRRPLSHLWLLLTMLSVLSAGLLYAVLKDGSSTAHAYTAPNLPANGKTLFIIGQDTDTLNDYKFQVLNVNRAVPPPEE